jgi:putative endonuclease
LLAQCLRHFIESKAWRMALSLSKGYMYFVYFLKSQSNQLYIGSTSDLQNRIIRHQNGEGAEFTFRNKAFNLVYTEEFQSLLEARRREKQIKGWRREKKENLIKFGKPNIVK